MIPYVIAVESACWLAGLVLCVLLGLRRLGSSKPALPPWIVPLDGFVTCALLITAGGFLMPHAATYLSDDILGPAARDGNWWMVVQGAAFQTGMLGGALLGGLLLWFRKSPDSPPDLPAAPKICQPILGGLITFLISLPLIGGIGLAWKTILDLCGHSVSEQDMVDMFRNADDPALLVFMIILAAVIAPITEELIFRAGIFRYLRTRIPRALALILPALLFALLHGNLTALVPLFALGVFFAYAYERTGSIAVPMIAHALFNLNTIVLVIAGVSA
ncbi:MAG: lysostaphin resistance A-like protein [Rariglobus sp.]